MNPTERKSLLPRESNAEINAAKNAGTTALETRFSTLRARTEQLAAPLSVEDCNLQSMPDASPVKWHLAHTSWFFETFILERFDPQFKPFHHAFRVLFNSYYNGVGDKHPRAERGLISRPDMATVLQYRRHVNERIAGLITAHHPHDAAFTDLIWLGCNHEEQHQELILTDLKHLLSKNPLKPAYQTRWPLTKVESRKLRWHHFDGGLVDIGFDGKSGAENNFAFDNETPRHRVYLQPFALASHPVTHRDFADFIAAGGYQRPELWLSLGWDWLNANNISAPLYWEKMNDKWMTFTLHGMVEIDDNTPVCHINFFEADAYARWKNARLPTEAEWEHAVSFAPVTGNFLESRTLHPLPSNEEKRDEKFAEHPQQLFGNVWEWTASAYLGYPGYAPVTGAVGEYNGKFMCNQFVLRGGSCVTPQQHIRATYRNFFPPDARWQFSGLRLARNV